MVRTRSIVTALLLATPLVAALGAVPASSSAAPGDDEPRALFTVTDPQITEASGLAVSLRHEGVLYTHNDSSDAPRVFAVGDDGSTLATFTVAGAEARDWEGMATGRDEAGRPVLYVADIGDNLGGAWPTVSVYRIPEPERLRDGTVQATRFRFRYAEGARNAEAILVHPRTGRLYVASRELPGGLYAAPKRLRTDEVNVLRRIGDAPPIVTGGDFAPDGSRYVLRTYLSASIYAEPGGRKVATVSLPDQPQGESVTYTRDGRALLVGSEGERSQVWRVPLSPGQTGETSAPSPPDASEQPDAVAPEEAGGYGGWALLLAALGAFLVVRWLRRRRNR